MSWATTPDVFVGVDDAVLEDVLAAPAVPELVVVVADEDEDEAWSILYPLNGTA